MFWFSKITPPVVVLIHLIVWIFIGGGSTIQLHQSFRVPPRDVEAKVGDNITMVCEVDNVMGDVQWAKDGMALGIVPNYDEGVLGFPRYKYVVDRTRGSFNLQIRNLSLNDEASYECQVGQKQLPTAVVPSIRAKSFLNVSVAPSSVEIYNERNNSKLDVRVNEEIRLLCFVSGSKPAPKVVWYRGNEEFKSGHIDEHIDCKGTDGGKKLCNLLSTLTFRPEQADDDVPFSCVVEHKFLPKDEKLFAVLYLGILYPPGQPFIVDFGEGDPENIIPEGRSLDLACRSAGGYPLAELRWFKNNDVLSNDILYSVFGKVSENKLRIVAKPDDNNAVYTCLATNAASPEPLRVSTRLSVAFGPDSVELSEVADATAGQEITFTCRASSSYPPAEIQWVVEDQSTPNQTISNFPAENGGTRTISTVRVTVPNNRKELSVSCYASNSKSSKNLQKRTIVNIYYPPGPPVIQGYTNGSYLSAGTSQELSCISFGGNPLANLTWYKNNRKVNVVTRQSDETSSFADIKIFVNKSDNGAEYRCEAMNPTLTDPLTQTIKLNVYFAPDNASVVVEPRLAHEGSIIKLSCASSSSNPPAEVTWWRNNHYQITDNITTEISLPDSFGGKQSSSELLLNATADMNQDTVTCRAMNSILQKGINFATRLEVLHKPVFKKRNYSSILSSPEGDYFSIVLEATANPSSITYYWRRGQNPLPYGGVRAQGPELRIYKTRRTDSGMYTCEARNNEGVESLSFRLDVTYEASITDITKVVTARNGSDAEMSCSVSGNPLDREDVLWTNQDVKDFARRAVTSFEDNTLTLKLSKVTVADMGKFYCTVNNRIGTEKNASTLLIVEHPPVVHQNYEAMKVAGNVLRPKFVCQGSGAPRLDFIWYKNHSTPLNRTVKYSIETVQIDELTYKSTLQIKDVVSSDFDNYYCIMRNKLGSARLAFELARVSIPDPPSEVNVTDVTHNTVLLSWTLNYNGDVPTHFRIKWYKKQDGPANELFQNISLGNYAIVSDLDSDTTYVFGVQAQNKYGDSNYSIIVVNTTSIAGSSKTSFIHSEMTTRRIYVFVGSFGLVCFVCGLTLLAYMFTIKRCRPGPDEFNNNEPFEMCEYAVRIPISEYCQKMERKYVDMKLKNDHKVDFVIEDINYPPPIETTANNSPHLMRAASGNHRTNNVYTSLGHLHSLPSKPPFENSDDVGTSTLPYRQEISEEPLDNDLPDGSSPTPSIPPPMSAISTHAYTSLQHLENYTRV